MEKETYFIVIFLVAILGTRLFLFIKPKPSPTIKGFRLHHYMYGILLLIISVFMKNIAFYAIGLALAVDQLPYVIHERKTQGGKNFNEKIYWQKKYLLELAGFMILVFLLKQYLLFF